MQISNSTIKRLKELVQYIRTYESDTFDYRTPKPRMTAREAEAIAVALFIGEDVEDRIDGLMIGEALANLREEEV